MELYDINRYALIVSPSSALLNWAVSEQPALRNDVDPDDATDLATVFLLPDFEDINEVDEWLEQHFDAILETLLEEWIADDSLWPERLEYSHFEKYADYTVSNMVIDTVEASYDNEEE